MTSVFNNHKKINTVKKHTVFINNSELSIICALAKLSLESMRRVFDGKPLIFESVEYVYKSNGTTATPLNGLPYESPVSKMFARITHFSN